MALSDFEPFPPVSLDAWLDRVRRELGGADPDQVLAGLLPEGLELRPLYTRGGGSDGATARPPFPRDARAPLVCSPCTAALPETAAAEVAEEVAGGAGALWLRLDRRRRGASTAEGAAGGDGGLLLDDLDDLATVLREVDLESLPVILDAGADALPVAAAGLALLEHLATDPERARLDLAIDPFAALAVDGTIPRPFPALELEIAAVVSRWQRDLPRGRSLAVSGEPFHAAGADAARELGLCLAATADLVRRLLTRGIQPATVGRQIVWRLALGRDIFKSIAKLRAARLLWAKLFAAFGVSETPPPRLHALASGRTLTRRDPWVNALRATTQLFAATVGGADLVTATCFDEVEGRPSAIARRLARNTQLILDAESGLAGTTDPSAGSYYVEELTDGLARAGWRTLRGIEAGGGLLTALLEGGLRRQLDAAWAERRKGFDRRTEAIVGVSAFPPSGHQPLPERSPSAPPAAAGAPRPGLPAEPPRGEGAAWLESAIVALSDGARLEELSASLAAGEPAPRVAPLPRRRDSARFEMLRVAGEALAGRPAVFLANLGPSASHAAAAAAAETLLAASGLRTVVGAGTRDGDSEVVAEALAAAFEASGCPIACLCGDEEHLSHLGPAACGALAAAGARRILVSGLQSLSDGTIPPSCRPEPISLDDPGRDLVTLFADLLAELGAPPEALPQ